MRIEQGRLIKEKDTDILLLKMESGSDESLSSLASMDYWRREIAKFEGFIAEKTARVQPSATSPTADVGC